MLKYVRNRFVSMILRASQVKTVQRHYTNHVPKTEYISTPIFYVNAAPHIGHLYSAVLADCIARYKSMLGHTTFLSTGTDEHGNKVENAAKTSNCATEDYCTKISAQFKQMCDDFHVDYSVFIRTTEIRHAKAVHHFWNVLDTKGYIYSGKYSGWYCMSDEAFLTDKEVDEKKDAFGKTIKISSQSGHLVEWMEEENYKFRLSTLQDDLKYWLKKETVVQPKQYHKILSSLIEDEKIFCDLSISRPTKRVPWSIPTPQNKDQSIYVWLEALVSYLTVLGYPEDTYKEFWPPSIQVIGKDILKFHGIYWPAFLIAAGLEPPQTLLCHAHWTVDNKKMSKSQCNFVSPFQVSGRSTVDGLRYFLLREAVPYNDSNYSTEKMLRTLNAELAHTLGNLIQRSTGKIINPWQEIPNPVEYDGVLKSDIAIKTIKAAKHLSEIAQSHYEKFNLHHVVDEVMLMLHMANQMFDYHQPWVLQKKLHCDQDTARNVKAIIALVLECTRISALILYPIIPKKSSSILDYLQIPTENRTWYDTVSQYENKNVLNERNLNENSTIFFRQIKI